MELIKKEPIIFVIAGKANSGKDTVAKIIKNEVMVMGLKAVNLQYSYYIKMYAKEITDWDGSEDTKPRTLLQQLGTEVIRTHLDNYFFINRIIEDIKVYSYFFDVVTISDARLPEELDKIKDAFPNVYKIGILRPEFNNSLDESQKEHNTEVALNSYQDYDFILNNNGTIEDLSIKIKEMLKKTIRK